MKILLAIACIIAITLNAAQAAQRVPPAEVSPVIHDGIEYRVNHAASVFIEHNFFRNNRAGSGGNSSHLLGGLRLSGIYCPGRPGKSFGLFLCAAYSIR
jgi:hypothetical protein